MDMSHYNVLDAKSRAAQLRNELNTHNHAYYVLGKPTITDAEYDEKFQDLKALEARWPQIADPNSPTCRVGSPVMSTFAKVQHERKMLSLDNAFKPADLVKFFTGKGKSKVLVVEPKIDGLSLSLVYKNGHLLRAVTRGDGTTGDDVTSNARVIQSIPLELSLPLNVEVRGEVYMPTSVFEKINHELQEAGEDVFANPRNAAAGTLKQKDSRIVSNRRLAFLAYNVGNPVKLTVDIARLLGVPGIRTHSANLVWLGSMGFIAPGRCPGRAGTTVDMVRKVQADDAGVMDSIIKELDEVRATLDLMTDGLVFKVDDLDAQEELGDGTRSPKWATAFKYPPERKPTALTAIEVTVGRHGKLTPVAILEPVQLSGSTVSRANLCNQDEVERLGINIGDVVLVEKSAEIIPKVMGLHTKHTTGTWHLPDCCPSCGSAVERLEGFVDYFCPSLACPEQGIQRLQHATSKACLDWDGFGEAQVKFFVGEAHVTQLSALLEFTASWVDTHMKAAAAKKFLKERERVKTAPLWRKIHALGIEGIGKSLSQDLCARFSSLQEMCNDIHKVSDIVGEVACQSFIDYMKRNIHELEKLESLGYVFSEVRDGAPGPLTGKVFCITGGLVSGKRHEVEARIMKAGGSAKSSVTKKVDYLIVGEGGGDKVNVANRLGTKQITEQQLYEMMGVPMPTAATNLLQQRGEL